MPSRLPSQIFLALNLLLKYIHITTHTGFARTKFKSKLYLNVKLDRRSTSLFLSKYLTAISNVNDQNSNTDINLRAFAEMHTIIVTITDVLCVHSSFPAYSIIYST